MPTTIPYPSLANPGNRLSIDNGRGDAPDEVRVLRLVDESVRGRGANVRYEDGSEGILWDSAYSEDSDATITVVG